MNVTTKNFTIKNRVLTEYTGSGGKVRIPPGVNEIGEYAFHHSVNVTHILLPPSVKRIGHHAFFYCKGLAQVIFSEGLTEIGEYAFSYCDSLTELELPESLLCIRKYAFSECASLKQITFPDDLLIWDYAFSGCHNLASMTAFQTSRRGRRLSVHNTAFDEDLAFFHIAFPENSSAFPVGDSRTFTGLFPHAYLFGEFTACRSLMTGCKRRIQNRREQYFSEILARKSVSAAERLFAVCKKQLPAHLRAWLQTANAAGCTEIASLLGSYDAKK